MAKLKIISALVCVTIMTGCAVRPSSGFSNSSALNETFLEQAQNYPRLIELYKEQLKDKESSEVRTKLAQIYIDTQDNESALFTLVPVTTQPGASHEAFYLQGVAQYNLGQMQQALNSLKIAINKAPKDAKSINMQGVVQAELGMLEDARRSFNQSRELMYDDITIKNNLALLDMMEGDYQAAATRLMPIYLNSTGKSDPNVKANLAIIVSKLGSFETLRSLYGKEYSDTELFDIFQNLRASQPTQKAMSEAKPIEVKKAKLMAPVVQSELLPSPEQPQPMSTQANNLASEVIAEPANTTRLTTSMEKKASQPKQDIDIQTVPLTPPIDFQTKDTSNEVRSVRLSDYSINSAKLNEQTQAASTTKQKFAELTGIKRNYGVLEEPNKETIAVLSTQPSAVQRPLVESTLTSEEQNFSDLMGVNRKLQNSTKINDEVSKGKRFVPLSDYSLALDQGLEIPVAQFKHHGNLIDVTLDENAAVLFVE